MKLRLALAAATALALPVAAHAQAVTGPYVSLGLGGSYVDPVNTSVSYGPGTGKTLYRPGYAGFVGVGYGLGNGFRIEIDGNDLRDSAHEIDANHQEIRGRLNTFGVLVNGLYDIPAPIVTPYVGVGIGYEEIQSSSFGGVATANNLGFNYSDTKGSPAFDAILGVAYATPVTGLSLTAEGRFIDAFSDRNYKLSFTGSPVSYTLKSGPEYAETLTLGLRYAFGTAPAPVPPAPTPVAPTPVAPAPAVAKTYLVFFDWNKSDLTPRATQIISEAATDSKTGATTLNVSGYTDTSGTPTYNQGLSLRRAKAVAAQLVTDGVAASEIEIKAYGETHLLVPTGPGVREPQNRRVEIVLQ
jgi:outer membrane protein OmpA-like peptidoglycan-associated protein